MWPWWFRLEEDRTFHRDRHRDLDRIVRGLHGSGADRVLVDWEESSLLLALIAKKPESPGIERRVHGAIATTISLAGSKVRDVYVGSQPDVVGEVPSDVIGVLVDHDVVCIPEPVIDEAPFERRDAEIVAVEPETLAASSL